MEQGSQVWFFLLGLPQIHPGWECLCLKSNQSAWLFRHSTTHTVSYTTRDGEGSRKLPGLGWEEHLWIFRASQKLSPSLFALSP